MPTLPLLGSMIGGRVDRRRVQHLRWSIERAKEERGSRRVQSGEERKFFANY
jgi:hypothetical protein